MTSIVIEKSKRAMKHRGIRFENEDWKSLAKVANEQEVYISDVVRHACKEFIKKYKKPDPYSKLND